MGGSKSYQRSRSFSISLASVVILAGSFITTMARGESAAPDIPRDLTAASGIFTDWVRSDAFTPATCRISLPDLYSQLVAAGATHFDQQQVASNYRQHVERISLARQALRDRLVDFGEHNKLDRECAEEIRRAMRVARYLEEYLINSFQARPAGRDKAKSPPIFAGGPPYLVGEESFGVDSLRSGDVLLSRGNAFASAAIARLGENDVQFSHLSIVYRHPETNQLMTVESWIELGGIIRPFDTGYGKDGHARVLVFRYGDQELAARAAQHAYDLVHKYKEKNGATQQYDFAMDMHEVEQLYCAEIISYAYDKAGLKNTPPFLTSFPTDSEDFWRQIGIQHQTSFAPADIEIDPRFELVAEWRDFTKLYDTNIKDAVLTSIFSWIEDPNLQYRFIIHPRDESLGWLLNRVRRFDWLAAITGLDQKFTVSMAPTTMAIFWTLGRLAEPLELEARRRDREHLQAKGRLMTITELTASLEAFRKQELTRFAEGSLQERQQNIHNHMRPLAIIEATKP